MHCEDGVVIYDDPGTADAFNAMYPEFGGNVPEGSVRRCFMEATLIIANCRGAMVPCEERLKLYYLIMAHRILLYGRGAGIVGQMTSASQGSVSLGSSPLVTTADSSPWLSTQYGTLFWQATAKYRIGPHIIKAPPRRPSRFASWLRRF